MRARRLGVPTAFAILGLLLVGVPMTSATGVNPDPPNPSSSDAQAALAAAPPGYNAYSETFKFLQAVKLLSTSCGAGCYALTTGYANITNASASLPGGSAYYYSNAAVTLVNCPSGCPPPTFTCDGNVVTVGIWFGTCLRAVLSFGGVHVSSLPRYGIQRQEGWTIPQTQTWFGTSTSASMTSQVESWPASIFGNLSRTGFLSFADIQMSWAVPLPQGNFVAASTTIQFLNTSTLLTASQFAVQSTWILLQWKSPPNSVCLPHVCQQPSSHPIVLRYQFTLEYASRPPNGGGGILPPDNGTQVTYPSVPVAGYTFNTYVVLPIANVTSTGGNNYTARVVWHNPYPWAVTGPFVVPSVLFLSSGTYYVSANGAPIPSTGFGESNTSVFVYPGEVTVPNGSVLALTVSFHYNLTFDPQAPLFLVNGYKVTSGIVVGAIGLAAGLALSLAEYNSPRLQKVRLLGSAEGVLLLVGLIIVWLGAL